jgi:hypothetical protein
MRTNGAFRYAKVWIELLPVEEGGRRTPLDLSSEWPVAYRPQLRVRGGDGRLLDVEFVAGPPDPVVPGSGAYATVRLSAASGASPAELVSGAEFDVLEGPRLIGRGRVG